MAHLTVIPSIEAVVDRAGQKLGPSDWLEIDQARIDAFADATGDHQWIHVDTERAVRETPWKSTIAHGYLTLSLVPHLMDTILRVEGWSRAINIGVEKLRLAAPVPTGSRVRLLAEIRDTRRVPGDGVRLGFWVRVEVEGSPKPALLGTVNYVYFP